MFATNSTAPAIRTKSAVVDDTQNIRFTDRTRADRTARQIISTIEALETVEELGRYVAAEDLLIDALYMFDPALSDAITEAADTHKGILIAGQACLATASGAPVIAQSPTTEPRKIRMFATNQTEGSRGPWMTWTSNGSAQKQFPPKSWVMRGTDQNDQKFERVIEGFAKPCVFDLDSLKLGWEKDGATGQAPDRRYSSHYSIAMPRPDESKKQNGAFTWSNALQVRVAISQTEAVTWEQGSFGAYQAATKLFKLIEAQWDQSQNGTLLPVVQMTSVEHRDMTGGGTNIPIFEIVKWVPRPDVLKDDAPAIATNDAPAQPLSQQAAAIGPAPQPAPAEQTAATAGGF